MPMTYVHQGDCFVWNVKRSFTGELVATTIARQVTVAPVEVVTRASAPPVISVACVLWNTSPPREVITFVRLRRYLSGWNCPCRGTRRHRPLSKPGSGARSAHCTSVQP